MTRRLVTCPICRTDQHIYNHAVANHTDGLLQCTGSRTPLEMGVPVRTFVQTIFSKMLDGIPQTGVYIQQKFYEIPNAVVGDIVVLRGNYQFEYRSLNGWVKLDGGRPI